MSNIYNQALLRAPKRNKFPLGSLVTGTYDAGYINPVKCIRVLPGDSFHGQLSFKLRTFPMKAPAYQQYDVSWFVFFCPERLLMNNTNWQKFIAEDENALPPAYIDYGHFATDSWHYSAFTIGVEPQSLANYLGMPVWTDSAESTLEDDTPIKLAPFLAYQKIYDEWFRDNNLITSEWDEIMTLVGDGGEISYSVEDAHLIAEITKLQHRAYKKDRFTSAMPETQKGSEVIIPLGPGTSQKIPVQNIAPRFRFGGTAPQNIPEVPGDVNLLFGIQAEQGAVLTGATAAALGSSRGYVVSGVDPDYQDVHAPSTEAGAPYVQVQLGDGTGVYVSLDTIPGVSVNAWRTAVMTQSFLERLETCGSRYTEVIRGMFGVFTPDARLQRPELIKAYRSTIMIGDVLQTEENPNEGSGPDSGESTPAGTLRGLGLGLGSGASFKYRAYEHGYLMVLMSILPRQSYSQGLPRMFTDIDRYDYFWPLLAHQGEEPILNRELYFAPGQKEDNETVFGYQSRYYDYRSSYDTCVGFIAPFENMDYWNGSRRFENCPTLSRQFIECRWEDSDQDRLFPVQFYPGKSMGYFHGQIYTSLKAWRPCPKFATPAII